MLLLLASVLTEDGFTNSPIQDFDSGFRSKDDTLRDSISLQEEQDWTITGAKHIRPDRDHALASVENITTNEPRVTNRCVPLVVETVCLLLCLQTSDPIRLIFACYSLQINDQVWLITRTYIHSLCEKRFDKQC